MTNVEYDLRKYRGVAFVLALFFGPFTWLYTYAKDKWKFCVGFALGVLGYITLIVGILFLPVLLLGIIILAVVHLWAIIDVLIKPSSFYDEYYKR